MRFDRLKATEFVKSLNEGNLASPGLQVVGVARPGGDKKEISFSFGLSCSRWIAISQDMLEHVDILGDYSCRDHTYKLVQLTFKAPATAEGKVLGSLLEIAAAGSSALQDNPTLSSARAFPLASPNGANFAFRANRCPPGYIEVQDSTGRTYCVPEGGFFA